MKTKIFKFSFILIISIFALKAGATSVSCNFTRDLYIGSWGEDVRCLQQYLSTSGAVYGTYVPPDSFFGPMTSQAVMQWQATYGLPASGYFDSMSRSKYFELLGFNINENYYGPLPTTSTEQKAKEKIKDAIEMIEDAEDEIEDSNKNTTSAKNNLEDAKDDMMDAIREFFVKRNFSKAFNYADDAYDNAEEAYEDAGGESRKEKAKDAIKDAKDAIDDAEDEIEEADDDGYDVHEAREILEDAEDLLDDAEDAYDDKDYSEAEDLADEAIERAEDAVDAID